jgi:hypothetical protein
LHKIENESVQIQGANEKENENAKRADATAKMRLLLKKAL